MTAAMASLILKSYEKFTEGFWWSGSSGGLQSNLRLQAGLAKKIGRGILQQLRPKKKTSNPNSGHFIYTRRNAGILTYSKVSLVALYNYKFIKSRTG